MCLFSSEYNSWSQAKLVSNSMILWSHFYDPDYIAAVRSKPHITKRSVFQECRKTLIFKWTGIHLFKWSTAIRFFLMIHSILNSFHGSQCQENTDCMKDRWNSRRKKLKLELWGFGLQQYTFFYFALHQVRNAYHCGKDLTSNTAVIQWWAINKHYEDRYLKLILIREDNIVKSNSFTNRNLSSFNPSLAGQLRIWLCPLIGLVHLSVSLSLCRDRLSMNGSEIRAGCLQTIWSGPMCPDGPDMAQIWPCQGGGGLLAQRSNKRQNLALGRTWSVGEKPLRSQCNNRCGEGWACSSVCVRAAGPAVWRPPRAPQSGENISWTLPAPSTPLLSLSLIFPLTLIMTCWMS